MIVTLSLFFVMGGGFSYLLASLAFAGSALYLGYVASQPDTPSTFSTFLKKLEIEEADKTFQNNYPLISELSVSTMQQVCEIFEKQSTSVLNTIPKSDLATEEELEHRTLRL
jgi:hypothetical protein